jgi:hypothetical protein
MRAVDSRVSGARAAGFESKIEDQRAPGGPVEDPVNHVLVWKAHIFSPDLELSTVGWRLGASNNDGFEGGLLVRQYYGSPLRLVKDPTNTPERLKGPQKNLPVVRGVLQGLS